MTSLSNTKTPSVYVDKKLETIFTLMAAKIKWIVVLLFLALSACSYDPSDTPSTPSPTAMTPLTAPGFDVLSRKIDSTSIEVLVTVTLNDDSGVSKQLNVARVGQTQQWQSESYNMPEGIPYSVKAVWSAVGVDGIRVDYAQASQSLAGSTSSGPVDLSLLAYSYREFNNDGGEANNYEELQAGTPPTGPPDPELPVGPDLEIEPVQASLEYIQEKTFRFTWQLSGGAEFYRVLENPDGVSGFTDISSELGGTTRNFDHRVALYARVNAQYVVQACNAEGCEDSDPLMVTGTLDSAVGYIKASNTGADDRFGRAVSLSADGSSLAIGAQNEDSSATGINGNEGNNSATSAGAVYMFVRSNGIWEQQAYLKASDTGAGDVFGVAVSLSADGNTLAVGAAGEDSAATGINGNEGNNSATNAGAAYVFVRSNGSWQQQAYLKASNSDAGDLFGDVDVSLSGDGNTLAVGAASEDSAATGINGDEADNSASSGGAVYVFIRNNRNWQQQAYLKASNTDADDRFGRVVNLNADGNTLAVGAQNEDSAATGINGNEADNSATSAGAVYVFVRSNGIWQQQAYLKASDTGAGDVFGVAVSLSGGGNTLAVGAAGEDSAATGINGNEGNNSATNSGAVYMFVRSNGVWQQQAYLKASNSDAGDLFGDVAVSLSADGNTLAVPAGDEDSAATGVNGNEGNNSASNAGAVYLFVRSNGIWQQQAYLKASNSDSGDVFGHVAISLSADGKTLAVPAGEEDSAATGINGDQTNNSADSSGAVYLY